MQAHQVEIINVALDQLLNKQSHFSICTVDKLARTLGTNCTLHPEYRFLNALHCVNYSDMSTDLQRRLPEMIMAVLSGRFDTGVMAKALAAIKSGEIKGLPETEDDLPTRRIRPAK